MDRQATGTHSNLHDRLVAGVEAEQLKSRLQVGNGELVSR